MWIRISRELETYETYLSGRPYNPQLQSALWNLARQHGHERGIILARVVGKVWSLSNSNLPIWISPNPQISPPQRERRQESQLVAILDIVGYLFGQRVYSTHWI